MRKVLLLGCIVGCLVSVSSMAGLIAYVDAELANTKIGGAAPQLNVNYKPSSTPTDSLWNWRAIAPQNGAGLWETDALSTSGDAESTPDISLDVVLPTAGVYELYALSMINGTFTGSWDIACRVGAMGDFVNYNKTSPAVSLAQASEFEAGVVINTSANRSVKVYLGQYVTSTENETVTIYVNGQDSWSGVKTDHRTVFDGVGYALVPEPASLAMLAAGAVMFRRRK